MDPAAEIAALRATVIDQAARVEALEAAVAALLADRHRAAGPRDDHEHAALVALALIVESATFTAADVQKNGEIDPAFGRCLQKADVWNTHAIGYLLRQGRGHVFAERRLERADERHAWRFVLDASGIGQP